MNRYKKLSKSETEQVVGFLEKGFKIRKRIKSLEEKIEFYKQRASSIPGINYEKERVQTQRNLNAPFEKWVELQIDAEHTVDEERKKLVDAEVEIYGMIDRLSSDEQKKILILRFMEDDTFRSIGDILNISSSNVYRLYSEALSSLHDLIGSAS